MENADNENIVLSLPIVHYMANIPIKKVSSVCGAMCKITATFGIIRKHVQGFLETFHVFVGLYFSKIRHTPFCNRPDVSISPF